MADSSSKPAGKVIIPQEIHTAEIVAAEAPPTQPAEDALDDTNAHPPSETPYLVPEPAAPPPISPAEPSQESEKLSIAVPSQPAEDSLSNPANDPILPRNRESLLDKARQFLQSPDILPQSHDRKRSFLVQKGLGSVDIEMLLSEVALPPPPLPPKTYPGAGKTSNLMRTLKILSKVSAYLAGSSAVVLLIYWGLIFPRLSNVLAARHELQARRLDQLKQLQGSLEAVAEKNGESPHEVLAASDAEKDGQSVAPQAVTSEKPVDISARLADLASSLESLRFARQTNRDRGDTLQSLTHLTGFISSRVYFTAGSSGKWHKRPVLGPVEEEVRSEIRALRGLALNRRSFIAAPSPTSIPPPSVGAMS